MSDYFKRANYFKRSDKNLDPKPFVKNWAFTMHKDNARIYYKEKKCYEISQFIAKYILSIGFGRDSFSVPDAVQLSGNVFKDSAFRDGVDIDTPFIKTIQILERDKRGTLYRAITDNDHNYYFRSEDSSESFDKIVNKLAEDPDLFVRRIVEPDFNTVPLVILSEED